VNFLIMHYASGWAFYSGFLLIITGTAMSLLPYKLLRLYVARLFVLIGLINVILSSTPISVFLLVLLILLIVLHLFTSENKKFRRRNNVTVSALVVLLSLYAILADLPFIFSGKPVKMATNNVWVIADSISAGIGFKGEKTWSEVLADNRKLKVVNKAVGGGTLASSINTLRKVNIGKDDLLILEIGGNDILAGAAASKFYAELDRLLADAAAKCERVIMLELPMPPFCGVFTGYQRELCSKYNVFLIPKRYFSWVITGSESTVDGLHLSNIGQKKMAEVISQHITK